MGFTYRTTLVSCFVAYIVQAVVNNFVPLLFVTFQSEFGIPLSQITLLITVNFAVQLTVDLLSARFVDVIGYRASIVAAHILTAVGLVLLTVLPQSVDPFAGILAAVVVYAIGGGIIEVLVSPIVEACPTDDKASAMSLLHSFYCWGAVGVILGSTLFFAVFGVENWRILTLLWALVPLCNTFNFVSCPIERLVEEGESLGVRRLLRLPLFWLIILLMVCSGASEAAMAQWASAFTESALGVSKTVGDLAGPGLFAVFMGISRMVYGRYSARLDLTRAMFLCGVLCAGCYLLASLSPSPLLGLAGCALCGLSVGIMWPGSISISAQKCPGGGTAMFAFLALAGDLGATVSPTLTGSFAELAGGSLKAGLLAATVFPVILVLGLLLLKKTVRPAAKGTHR